jgi:hypothetical protein
MEISFSRKYPFVALSVAVWKYPFVALSVAGMKYPF